MGGVIPATHSFERQLDARTRMTWGAFCTPRCCDGSKAQNTPLKIKSAFCTSDFGNVAEKMSATLYQGPSLHFAILIHLLLVPDILTATNQNENFSFWFWSEAK